jgi:hypothetical protein
MGQNSSLTFGPCWRASYLSPCLNYRSSIKLPLIERCTHSFGPMAPTSILRRCTIGRTTSMRWRRAHEIGNFSPPDAQDTVQARTNLLDLPQVEAVFQETGGRFAGGSGTRPPSTPIHKTALPGRGPHHHDHSPAELIHPPPNAFSRIFLFPRRRAPQPAYIRVKGR